MVEFFNRSANLVLDKYRRTNYTHRVLYMSKIIIDIARNSNVYYLIHKVSSLMIGYKVLFLAVYSIHLLLESHN